MTAESALSKVPLKETWPYVRAVALFMVSLMSEPSGIIGAKQ